jgi:hypothetical protein
MSEKLKIEISLEMKSSLHDPATKAAWMSENVSDNENDCKNCGGVGYLYLFLATAGPFVASPAGVNKWDENLQKWWVGETKAFKCPICQESKTNGEEE